MLFGSPKLTVSLLMLGLLVWTPSSHAQEEDPQDRPDARVEGYLLEGDQVGRIMIENASGNATTWFILAGLGILGIGVMFKSGRRTHLD